MHIMEPPAGGRPLWKSVLFLPGDRRSLHPGALDEIGKSVDDLLRHGSLGADPEIVARAFGLGAPIFIGRHFDLAHSVFFDTKFHMLRFWIYTNLAV